jgi:hypothetical protein
VALIPTEPALDPAARQQLALALMGQALGSLGRQQQTNQLLHGTQGPGLEKLAAKGAPGLDASLAGPSLAMTGNRMATPGIMTGRDPDEEGGYRALLQQAFANRNGGGWFGGQ